MEHLIEVIKGVGSRFILETNGLVLGYSPKLACSLNNLNVAVRVALKGWDERSFEIITGADGEYFRYQIDALKELINESINVWPAVMYDVFGEKGVLKIREKLSGIGIERIEFEHLERYPFVITNLRKKGIKTLPFEG